MGKIRNTHDALVDILPAEIEILSTINAQDKNGENLYYHSNRSIDLSCRKHAETFSLTPSQIRRKLANKTHNQLCPSCIEESTPQKIYSYITLKTYINSLSTKLLNKQKGIVNVELMTTEEQFLKQRSRFSNLGDNLMLKVEITYFSADKKEKKIIKSFSWRQIQKEKSLIESGNKNLSLMHQLINWYFYTFCIEIEPEFKAKDLMEIVKDKNKLNYLIARYPNISYDRLAYDFLLSNFKILIEVDGIQHFESTEQIYGVDTKEIHYRDEFKNALINECLPDYRIVRVNNFDLDENGNAKNLQRDFNTNDLNPHSIFGKTYENLNIIFEAINVSYLPKITYAQFLDTLMSYPIQDVWDDSLILARRNRELKSQSSTLRAQEIYKGTELKTTGYLCQCIECKSYQINVEAQIYNKNTAQTQCYSCRDRLKIESIFELIEKQGFIVLNKPQLLDKSNQMFRFGAESEPLQYSRSKVDQVKFEIAHPNHPLLFLTENFGRIKRNFQPKKWLNRLNKLNSQIKTLGSIESLKNKNGLIEVIRLSGLFDIKNKPIKKLLRQCDHDKKVQNIAHKMDMRVQKIIEHIIKDPNFEYVYFKNSVTYPDNHNLITYRCKICSTEYTHAISEFKMNNKYYCHCSRCQKELIKLRGLLPPSQKGKLPYNKRTESDLRHTAENESLGIIKLIKIASSVRENHRFMINYPGHPLDGKIFEAIFSNLERRGSFKKIAQCIKDGGSGCLSRYTFIN